MFKSIYVKSVLWLMDTKFYYFVVMNIVPYVRFTLYYTSFRGWQYKRGYAKLQPGDFIVVLDSKKLTNVIIPGTWNHAAPCIEISPASEWEFSEMTHHNYTMSTFSDIAYQSTRTAIFRCTKFDQDYINNVFIPNIKKLKDALYDVDFEDGKLTAQQVMKLPIPHLYCSALIYQADSERRLGVVLQDLAGLGIPYVGPTDLTQAANVVCIWDSAAEVAPVWHD